MLEQTRTKVDPDSLQIALQFVRAHTSVQVIEEAGATGFFTGINLKEGVIKFDPVVADLGDLLHEVGHLTTTPLHLRRYASDDMCTPVFFNETQSYVEEHKLVAWPGDDDASTYWAFCACRAAGLDDYIPFSRGYGEDGYDLWQATCLGVGNSMGSRFSVPLYYLGLLSSKGSDKPVKWEL